MSEVIVETASSNLIVSSQQSSLTVAAGVQGPAGVVGANSPIVYLSDTKLVGFDQSAQNTTNDARYARLGAANTFTLAQTINADLSALRITVNSGNSNSFGGNNISGVILAARTANAAAIPLAVRGAASQTANLQEWQDSAGTISASYSLGPTGLYVDNNASLRGVVGIGGNSSTTYQMAVYNFSSAPARIPLMVRGAASQTANLQEWQNSAGSVLSLITSSGVIFAPEIATTGSAWRAGVENSGGFMRLTRQTTTAAAPGSNIGKLYFRDGTTAGTLKLVVRAGTAGVETTILDNIPQS